MEYERSRRRERLCARCNFRESLRAIAAANGNWRIVGAGDGEADGMRRRHSAVGNAVVHSYDACLSGGQILVGRIRGIKRERMRPRRVCDTGWQRAWNVDDRQQCHVIDVRRVEQRVERHRCAVFRCSAGDSAGHNRRVVGAGDRERHSRGRRRCRVADIIGHRYNLRRTRLQMLVGGVGGIERERMRQRIVRHAGWQRAWNVRHRQRVANIDVRRIGQRIHRDARAVFGRRAQNRASDNRRVVGAGDCHGHRLVGKTAGVIGNANDVVQN